MRLTYAVLGMLLTAWTLAPSQNCPIPPKVRIRKEVAEPVLPTPAPGKALIVVVRGRGDYLIAPVAANGKWIGANAGWTYFYEELEPGTYVLCTGARFINATTPRSSPFALKAEAGETYYFEQTRP